jgi:hypothetical protein
MPIYLRPLTAEALPTKCKACLSHVSLCSDDERGTSPVFPAHAQGLSPYQDTRWKHHWWMTTDRLPCRSTQAWLLLLAVPVMSRRCLSRTLSIHRRRTSVSCVGPFGKRGTACGIHYSAGPDADSHLSASSTALGHQRSIRNMIAISTRE